MEKGFAQTWFFKSENESADALLVDGGAGSGFAAPLQEKTTRTAIMDHDANASFFDVSAVTSKENIPVRDFSGVFEKKAEEQKKKASREENCFAPQNF